MSRPNALYEAPGPVGRRRQRAVSVLSALAVCGLLVAIGIRLEASGQFEADKWAIFLHWGTAKFLFDGLVSTIAAAACSALVAFAMALPLALWRLSKRPWVSRLAGAYIEFFRAIPLLLLILFMVIELPSLGFDWPALGFLVFAMALHHSALTAEVVRAGILSLPRGQCEAALALGLRPAQAMLYVVLPQALRSMLPALISSVLAIVQDTSLGYVIPYDELLHRSQDVSSYAPQSLLQAAFIVTLMYGVVSAALLYLKRWVMRRQGRAPAKSTARSGMTMSSDVAAEIGASIVSASPRE
ncbi:Amine acid ABC transporter, permease protein, 3-TM region, His/Glu/Gln/Arg/opine family [Paraburkholderia ribeironis]|uniref:Amine acid ABC transporter, permease protein, 3-TM region, His/Glu/Gln/Arg/opine family n=1 Tax=Paraburkholderia ribeironis TaxID=1247936 RepID=A0A1N7SIM5_9BURK|nr:amino acid ABC transporter permease [Paraburkholderia ribeironis]SIT47241.1 Amine acid ABC transporter, permease protein, 3-TM region, His/Glu/Gln/Arg/opine family [Paraburkholderia ribeironis]